MCRIDSARTAHSLRRFVRVVAALRYVIKDIITITIQMGDRLDTSRRELSLRLLAYRNPQKYVAAKLLSDGENSK
jgi:hypothetical protein